MPRGLALQFHGICQVGYVTVLMETFFFALKHETPDLLVLIYITIPLRIAEETNIKPETLGSFWASKHFSGPKSSCQFSRTTGKLSTLLHSSKQKGHEIYRCAALRSGNPLRLHLWGL